MIVLILKEKTICIINEVKQEYQTIIEIISKYFRRYKTFV